MTHHRTHAYGHRYPYPVARGADWSVSEERGRGVPRVIYGAECLTCDARSPVVEDDAQPVTVWVIEHTRETPDHGRFLIRGEKHWRVDCPTAPTPPAPEPRRGPVAAFVDRAFGPTFVGLMCVLTVATGLLMASA
ncbi:hypothetical protein [Streptomyces profundus]|uniref:DUF7848 domain-containing protein n=1 Tax=Streptomyces profundus TaxID=2867410 RepID=UPI001D16E3BF|nr:hypothetical protein [Streptomyces sp. MA3_2.13]UED84874.1 hypothetical protein K4G22_12205 [Streptomyces sp. MA3_2.13]